MNEIIVFLSFFGALSLTMVVTSALFIALWKCIEKVLKLYD